MVIVACHEIYVAFMDMPAKATGFQRQPAKVFVSAQRKKISVPSALLYLLRGSATLLVASSARLRRCVLHAASSLPTTTLPSPTAAVRIEKPIQLPARATTVQPRGRRDDR
jgi:hypothetical protein